MLLAFQAGILNIGGFMACHSFVSHITGFATLFAYGYKSGDTHTTAAMLIVPGFFLAGAMISGILVDLRLRLHKKPRYYVVFGVLFLLLLFTVIGGSNGLFGDFGKPHRESEDFTLLALLCLACGLQNGLVTLVSRSVVRTTHLTGITTDLGIGVIRVLNRHRIPGGIGDEIPATFMRVGIIAFFFMGSMAGFELFHGFGFRGFLVPMMLSAALFFSTLYFQLIQK